MVFMFTVKLSVMFSLTMRAHWQTKIAQALSRESDLTLG